MIYANPQCMSYLIDRSRERTEELQQAAKREPTTDERRTWRIMFRAALLLQRDRDQGDKPYLPRGLG